MYGLYWEKKLFQRANRYISLWDLAPSHEESLTLGKQGTESSNTELRRNWGPLHLENTIDKQNLANQLIFANMCIYIYIDMSKPVNIRLCTFLTVLYLSPTDATMIASRSDRQLWRNSFLAKMKLKCKLQINGTTKVNRSQWSFSLQVHFGVFSLPKEKLRYSII